MLCGPEEQLHEQVENQITRHLEQLQISVTVKLQVRCEISPFSYGYREDMGLMRSLLTIKEKMITLFYVS